MPSEVKTTLFYDVSESLGLKTGLNPTGSCELYIKRRWKLYFNKCFTSII